MTSVYLEELNPGASVMSHPERRRKFPWRKEATEGGRGEQASSSSGPAAPSRTPEESGEGRASDDGSEREDNASNAELPSGPDRSGSEGKSPRSEGEWQKVEGKVKGRRVRLE